MEILQFAGWNNNVFGKQKPHFAPASFFLSFFSLPCAARNFNLMTCRCISLHYTTLEREFLILLNINHEYITMLSCFTVFTVTNLNQNTFNNII